MDKVVIGIGYGDEGKGHVVDWLCSNAPANTVVRRYSGGHQVGHCVDTGTEKHIFSNFGYGTMQGIPTHWDAKTVDPVGFCNEFELIKRFKPKIYIEDHCPVTTPFDKVKNKLEDAKHGHGSVGVGFGTTIQREEANFHLYFKDLFYPWVLRNKIELIKLHYYPEITIPQSTLESFYSACDKMTHLVMTTKPTSTNTIYESSQGLMLDMDYGFFPHVTRSRLGTQELDTSRKEYYLVTRAYQTRHGNGPCSPHYFEPNNPKETNVYNRHQGKFLTGVLDLDLLHYAINIDKVISNSSSNRSLVITCIDQIDTAYEVSSIEKGIQSFTTVKEFMNTIIAFLPPMKAIYISVGPTAKDIFRWG